MCSIYNCSITIVNEVNNDFNKQIVPPTPDIETNDGENNNIKVVCYAATCGNRKSHIIFSKELLSKILYCHRSL